MDRELRLLKIRKAADALNDGQLLATESSIEVRQAAVDLVARRVDNDKKHTQDHRRAGHRLSRVRALVCRFCPYDRRWCPLHVWHMRQLGCFSLSMARSDTVTVGSKVRVDLTGKKLFFGDITVSAAVARRMARLSATVTGSRMTADVIVVADIAKPGSRSHWVAVLLGVPIIGLECLTRTSGPSITYRAAVTQKFTVCMTPGFRRAYPVLSQIVTLASAKPHARWRLVDALPVRAGATWLVFATPAETVGGQVPRAISPSAFLARFGKPVGLAIGACGL